MIVFTVGFIGTFSLVDAADTGWQVALLAPSVLVAMWFTSRWEKPRGRAATLASLGFTWASWLAAVMMDAGPATVTPLVAVGATVVATLPQLQRAGGAALAAVVGLTAWLGSLGHPDSTGTYVIVSLIYTAIFGVTFWLNAVGWRLFTEPRRDARLRR
ncbi:hypothetical protein GCM10025876_34480 [Demequina litorisediminis]|uniref:Uncharacterized protein n=1 Tax=Demequina litorisediminis TaxID=1849022 RepID=A0ABQ6IKP9_9MICO|nr:hypothetical protein GCM10025876_34480 [Demequina litorisediminis]